MRVYTIKQQTHHMGTLRPLHDDVRADKLPCGVAPPPLILILLQADKLRFPQLRSAPLQNILVINHGQCVLSAPSVA